MSVQKKLEWANKRTKFAWSAYYRTEDKLHDANVKQYELQKKLLLIGDDLPIHLVSEIETLHAELQKQIQCPICMEVIQTGKLKITICGHKFCEDCFKELDNCAMCRRKFNN